MKKLILSLVVVATVTACNPTKQSPIEEPLFSGPLVIRVQAQDIDGAATYGNQVVLDIQH